MTPKIKTAKNNGCKTMILLFQNLGEGFLLAPTVRPPGWDRVCLGMNEVSSCLCTRIILRRYTNLQCQPSVGIVTHGVMFVFATSILVVVHLLRLGFVSSFKDKVEFYLYSLIIGFIKLKGVIILKAAIGCDQSCCCHLVQRRDQQLLQFSICIPIDIETFVIKA